MSLPENSSDERRARTRIQALRLGIQGSLFILILFLGFRFWQYVRHFETFGQTPPVPHPSGVEAFLPIGGLTNLKYWFLTGQIHPFHPASMILFVGALAVSLVLKKGFCGWICPVGLLSEQLYKPWKKKFGRSVQPPKSLDVGLRGLKYVLLAFFLWAIGFMMDLPRTQQFLDGEYWKIADVKMLKFFTNISALSLGVIAVLILLSIPIRNFWCRYLCPYGALLGITGLFSPLAIWRDNDKCVHCKKCTRNCPAYLGVEASKRVWSPECTSCLTCLSGCPKGALTYCVPRRKWSLPGWAYPVVLLAIFFGLIFWAKATGHWRAQVPQEDLQRLIPEVQELEHPR